MDDALAALGVCSWKPDGWPWVVNTGRLLMALPMSRAWFRVSDERLTKLLLRCVVMFLKQAGMLRESTRTKLVYCINDMGVPFTSELLLMGFRP